MWRRAPDERASHCLSPRLALVFSAGSGRDTRSVRISGWKIVSAGRSHQIRSLPVLAVIGVSLAASSMPGASQQPDDDKRESTAQQGSTYSLLVQKAPLSA